MDFEQSEPRVKFSLARFVQQFERLRRISQSRTDDAHSAFARLLYYSIMGYSRTNHVMGFKLQDSEFGVRAFSDTQLPPVHSLIRSTPHLIISSSSIFTVSGQICPLVCRG